MHAEITWKAATVQILFLSISQRCGLNSAFSNYGNKKGKNKKLQEKWGRLKRDVFAMYESILKARWKQGQKKAKDEKKQEKRCEVQYQSVKLNISHRVMHS